MDFVNRIEALSPFERIRAIFTFYDVAFPASNKQLHGNVSNL